LEKLAEGMSVKYAMVEPANQTDTEKVWLAAASTTGVETLRRLCLRGVLPVPAERGKRAGRSSPSCSSSALPASTTGSPGFTHYRADIQRDFEAVMGGWG